MADPNERVATYVYDGLFRRVEKVVANQGDGIVYQSDVGNAVNQAGIEAGDRHEHCYYSGWRLVELRNGAYRTLSQFVYGTQYIDELIRYDRNTDPAADTSCLDVDMLEKRGKEGQPRMAFT